jgi:hypothetical protein
MITYIRIMLFSVISTAIFHTKYTEAVHFNSTSLLLKSNYTVQSLSKESESLIKKKLKNEVEIRNI